MTHYRANVNHRSADCFCYFSSKQKMFDWISEKVGEKISSFADIKKWNEKMYVGVAHAKGSIEIESFKDLKDFFKYRRAYVLRLRLCDDLMYRMQRLGRCIKRDVMLESFARSYEDANEYCACYPAIWQGEI